MSSSSTWTPTAEAVSQLTRILEGTLSASHDERSAAQAALETAKQQPDLNNYLLYLLVEPIAKPEIRASAGLFLKNNLHRTNLVDPGLLAGILKGLVDTNVLVRNITGNVITSIFSLVGFANWRDLIPQLLELASQGGEEGAMGALLKICEDSSLQLDRDPSHPLQHLIPNLIRLLETSTVAKIRAQAILCVNQFFKTMSQSLLVNLDDYLVKLFQLVQDPDGTVRKNICSAFSLILEARPDKVVPHLDGIVNYIVHSINTDQDEEVQLEACEFLLSLSSSDVDRHVITPKLGIILETLLNKMVYSELEIFLIEEMDAKADNEVEDTDNDIKPQHAKSTQHTTSKKQQQQQQQDNDSDDNDDDDDDDSEIGDLSEWNIRKCSAATLDVFASVIPEEIMGIVLPLLKPRITSDAWPIREAAILAMGAISEGCLELSRDSLPELVPFLCDRLQDKEPRVRQITCWTLGRYSPWICSQAYLGGEYKDYFEITFTNIMRCALDDKKVVQEAACSAIASFIENCEYDLISGLIEPILQFFHSCFHKYRRKNLIILYDSIQTFVEKIGEPLASREEYIELLLPPLIQKWQALQDNDKDLWPLLECMSSVAAALGEAFAPFAVDVYARAVKILHDCIEQDKLFQIQSDIDTPEKDFMVTSLDLIDGLVQGLKQHVAQLILQHDQQSKFSLMQLLLSCFEDPVDDVRQSSFALLGDLSIYTPHEVVKPYIHLIIITIGNEVNNRNFNSSAVCNNAVWALGELSLRLTHEELAPYLSNLIAVLIPLLNATDVQSTVLENAAITLGRIACASPLEINSCLEDALVVWSTHMKYLEENDEKSTAFTGICRALLVKPLPFASATAKRALARFIDCIGFYEYPGDELALEFSNVLQGYRNILGPQVFTTQVLNYVDDAVRDTVQNNYRI